MQEAPIMSTTAIIMLDEICALISAQLDMLESATPLTSDQLIEMHNLSEIIRMLCEDFGSAEREGMNGTECQGSSVIRKRIRAKSLAA
jgi:hypothetical protein